MTSDELLVFRVLVGWIITCFLSCWSRRNEVRERPELKGLPVVVGADSKRKWWREVFNLPEAIYTLIAGLKARFMNY